jgi:hypothetical protein
MQVSQKLDWPPWHATAILPPAHPCAVLCVVVWLGMTVEVPPRRREGYCRLVHCANALDLYGAAQALHTIGYVTTQSHNNPERYRPHIPSHSKCLSG